MGPSDFACALRFLTRLPLPPTQERAAGGPVRFGAAAFPLVGLLLGAGAIGVDVAAGAVPLPVRSVAILALWALVTGALHYDGLADVLDALGAGARQERLRIMREASIGTFAVLGVVFVVALELAALGSLAGPPRHRALLVAPMLARLAMLWAAFEAPRAREDGLGAEFVSRLEAREVIVATVLAVCVTLALSGARGVAALAVVAFLAAAVRRGASAAFGGITGDVLGASGKLAETAVLVLWAVR